MPGWTNFLPSEFFGFTASAAPHDAASASAAAQTVTNFFTPLFYLKSAIPSITRTGEGATHSFGTTTSAASLKNGFSIVTLSSVNFTEFASVDEPTSVAPAKLSPLADAKSEYFTVTPASGGVPTPAKERSHPPVESSTGLAAMRPVATSALLLEYPSRYAITPLMPFALDVCIVAIF